MTQQKRSHEELEDASPDAAAVASDIQQSDSLHKCEQREEQKQNEAQPDDGWQVAESRASKRRKKIPRKESDKYPSIKHSSQARLQSVVKISDLQNLFLYLLADGLGPQWCSVQNHGNIKKVVVLMVPGLEMEMFRRDYALPSVVPAQAEIHNPDATESNSADAESSAQPAKKIFSTPDDFYPSKMIKDNLVTPLQPLADIFEHVWPVKSPGDDKFAKLHSPLAAMLSSAIVKDKEDKVNGKGPSAPAEAKRWQNKRTHITEMMVTSEELLTEGYTMHPAHFHDDASAAETYMVSRAVNKTTISDGWLDTPNITSLADGEVDEAQIESGSVTAGRQVLAIDCEMCITSPPEIQPPVFSLTRMSVVDWNGEVVLDELVKPEDPITDYLTPYSGITAKLLENVTTTLQEAQQKLLTKITPYTILVGHSLDSDLKALRLTHPFIVDTALLYPHPRGSPLKSSLKWLAQKYLSRPIQSGHGTSGHDSIEDAKASLDLVKQKCEKGKAWGTSEASSESVFRRLARSKRSKKQKLHPDGEEEPRLGAVVDWGEPKRGFGAAARVAIGCKDDSEVVAGVKRAVNGDEACADLPTRGVDFTWARLRELEAYRGWWNSSKTLDGDALREAATEQGEAALLGDILAKTVSCIGEICDALPPCTAVIIYSGSSDPRKLARLQEMKQKHKAEYAVKNWDQLSIVWTENEERELKRACEAARRGIGFITVK